MPAPDRLVVVWTLADEDTMPATVSAHTEKSRDFVSGAPRWMDGERIEYVRADLAPDPALFAEVVEALRGMVANACAAAKIKGNMMIIICTNEEWESHVAATEAARAILAKLDGKP